MIEGPTRIQLRFYIRLAGIDPDNLALVHASMREAWVPWSKDVLGLH